MPESATLTVSVRRGRIPDYLIEYAHDRFDRLGPALPAPLLYARLVLDQDPDPAVERGAYAKASLDVNGRVIRAQVAAPSMREAIDLVMEKLRRELRRLSEVRLARRARTGLSGPGTWRHADQPTARPSYFPRPREERGLVRRKTYALAELTVGEALFDMELLDYDWHLFVEAETGADAVLELRENGLYLHTAGTRAPERFGVAEAVETIVGAPRLTVEDAIAILDETDAPWHFFVETTSGRGTVVYRRYDGHYGLVTAVPSAAEVPDTTEPDIGGVRV